MLLKKHQDMGSSEIYIGRGGEKEFQEFGLKDEKGIPNNF